MAFAVKDSGVRESFATGAVRDTSEGKPRFDLLPVTALRRIADHYAAGAKKYDAWNWAKGIVYSRCFESAMRHLSQWREGDRSEDHLAAVCFNVMCLLDYDVRARTDLDDLTYPVGLKNATPASNSPPVRGLCGECREEFVLDNNSPHPCGSKSPHGHHRCGHCGAISCEDFAVIRYKEKYAKSAKPS